MPIKLHLFIRFLSTFGLIVAGVIAAISMGAQSIISTFIILGIGGYAIEKTFIKKIPARCPSCKASQAYATKQLGALAYSCRACNEYIRTNIMVGASDGYDARVHDTAKGQERKKETIQNANRKEMERLHGTRKRVSMKKGIVRQLWDKILPKDY